MDFAEWKESLTDEQKAVMNKYVDNSDKPGIIKSSKKVRATEIEEKRSIIRTGSSLWSKEQLDKLIRTENEIIKNPYETAVVYSKIGTVTNRSLHHMDNNICIKRHGYHQENRGVTYFSISEFYYS